MSEHDTPSHPVRTAKGGVLGGLAAGALLGATVAAQLPQPAETAPAAPTIREQFQDAFTPGALDLAAKGQPIVVNVS